MVAALLAQGPIAQAGDFDGALALYKANLKRPSLCKRMLGRARLADTGDPRALEILVASYAKAEQPRDQVQYLLVNCVTERFHQEEDLLLYANWRRRQERPEDAWLWFKTLLPQYEAHGASELVALVRGSGNVFLRCAALEVFSNRQDAGLLAMIPALAELASASGVARAVYLESLASALAEFAKLRAKPEFRAPAEAILRCMEEAATLPRTRIVMARCLARALGVKFHFREAARW